MATNSQVYILFSVNGTESDADNMASRIRAQGGRVLRRNPKFFAPGDIEVKMGEGESAIPIGGVFVLRGSPNEWEIQQAYAAVDYPKLRMHPIPVTVFDPPEGPAPSVNLVEVLAGGPAPAKPKPKVDTTLTEGVKSFAEAFGAEVTDSGTETEVAEIPDPPKRKRGRPRKAAAAAE